MKALRLKTHHFHTKLPSQNPMLRQIKWTLQNRPIKKNGVLPVTTLFFLKFCFSLRTSYKKLICCTTTKMPIFLLFVNAGVSFDGAIKIWTMKVFIRVDICYVFSVTTLQLHTLNPFFTYHYVNFLSLLSDFYSFISN